MHHPNDYARVVRAIGNEMDITLVDLEDILPQVGGRADGCVGVRVAGCWHLMALWHSTVDISGLGS